MLPKQGARLVAKAILGTGPKDPESAVTPHDAYAAGTVARAQSAARVAAPYRSWDLQREFIAGWNHADAAWAEARAFDDESRDRLRAERDRYRKALEDIRAEFDPDRYPGESDDPVVQIVERALDNKQEAQ